MDARESAILQKAEWIDDPFLFPAVNEMVRVQRRLNAEAEIRRLRADQEERR